MVDTVAPHLQATLDKILGAIEDTKVTLQWDISQVSVESPDEAWQWLEMHKAGGSTTDREERAGRRGHRGPRRQRSKPRLRVGPTQTQKESAKKAALEAVALLQCRDSSVEASGRDSDRASETSKEESSSPDWAPKLTPQTGNELG
ncbi:hypothetical protein NDU88_001376 [Pleurodeles waltl]|uniref:Uncharacterized protein n=1 Tax=Pleurodeles waltl TaxID=8319 RepID=A0AAV7USL2_PLEWA|nr:hypothetical protein NDU88_001376 [Pleurodeles waltl]